MEPTRKKASKQTNKQAWEGGTEKGKDGEKGEGRGRDRERKKESRRKREREKEMVKMQPIFILITKETKGEGLTPNSLRSQGKPEAWFLMKSCNRSRKLSKNKMQALMAFLLPKITINKRGRKLSMSWTSKMRKLMILLT